MNLADLPGIDPDWSVQVSVPSRSPQGRSHLWHVLDNLASVQASGHDVIGTILCVHGNPTWSYLWRRVVDQAPPGWRVVAVDQLSMGWSERLDEPRTMAQRIDDLGDLTKAMEITGPVITLAHDWGGPISLGWAIDHPEQLQATILTNTAVHQPADQPKPIAITTTRSKPLIHTLCARTPAFVRATTALCLPPLGKPLRDAFASPYASVARRQPVADFVADIPFETDHPSFPTLERVAEGVKQLAVPALFVWGMSDPVFSPRYLTDLQRRMPHADVQTYPKASHLVLEDKPEGVGVIWQWITDHFGDAQSPARDEAPARPAQGELLPIEVDATEPDELAIVELASAAGQITRGALAQRVADVAGALDARGVKPGQRVAVLVPPGIDLTTIAYAVWRLGAVVVVADAGLGLPRLGAALRGASPDHVIGIRKALALTSATRVPGKRIAADPDDVQALIADSVSLPDLEAANISPDADAALLFTSGATGPPKAVAYTRTQLSAQIRQLRDTFGLHRGERFVAAFAPFALYGPALGLTSAVPNMDVTAPHTLTAQALGEAVAAIDATVVFASPAALRNVVATTSELTPSAAAALTGPRLVLSAGAPVPAELLLAVKDLLTNAETHTPYGMTEALPIATVDPTTQITDASDGGGVCVGTPLEGVEIAISPLDQPAETLVNTPGVVGDIVVRAAHVKERYDRLWAVQRESAQPAGWHRTGDVGHLDSQGRLWVEGRAVHVLATAQGALTPYPLENDLSAVSGVQDVAVVGVGPVGTQQVVVVVVPQGRLSRGDSAIAEPDLAARVRDAASVPVAAVLVKDWLPVDIRHASKVDRTALAAWASDQLQPAGIRERVARAPRKLRGAPSTKSRA